MEIKMASNLAIVDGNTFYITANATDMKGSCDFYDNALKCHATVNDAISAITKELHSEEEGSAYVFEVRAIRKLKALVEKKVVVAVTDVEP
jgi:hypothetical protein